MMRPLFFIFCMIAAGLAAAEVGLEIRPEPPVAGEVFQLVLTSGEGRPAVDSLPEVPGIEWFRGSTSSGYRNINGRSSYTVGIAARADKPGSYRIPAFTVRVGRQS